MKRVSILLSVFIIIFLVLAFLLVTGSITKYTGYFVDNTISNEKFKSCLSNQDLKLYINSVEVLKNLNFQYLSYFKIIDCKISKDEECKNINKPLWSINGLLIEGEITEDDLSQMSSCKL